MVKTTGTTIEIRKRYLREDRLIVRDCSNFFQAARGFARMVARPSAYESVFPVPGP